MSRSKPASSFIPPDGQTVRGTGAAYLPNPKNDQARRPDVIKVTPDASDGLTQPGRMGTSTNFPGTTDMNQADKGDRSSVPDVSVTNRGYTEIEDVGPSRLKHPSANRQKYGINPGTDTLDPVGVSVDKGRDVPKFGVGTTGE